MWVDVSHEPPPLKSVLRYLPWLFSSPTSRSWCYLTTSASVFLTYFPLHLHHHHSLATYSSSLFNTCPYHFNILFCTFLDISPTFVVQLILSFLILTSLVAPLIHLNILMSTVSNFFSCAFFTTHASAPCNMAGLTTVLYTFLLTHTIILRSHRTLDAIFNSNMNAS